MPRSPQPQPAALEEEERPDPFAEGPRRGEPEPRPAAAPDSNDSKDSAKGFEMPPWSVRVDPLNWLLEGRFGLELEAGVWKILSVEVVPAFITNEQPPTLDLSSFPDVLHQKSNGLGALAGVSTSVGIWLSGKPFDGFVLRPFYSVLALRYESRDAGVQIDATDRTEHFLGLMLGSEDKWGAFTIGYSFGLAKNLNDQRRCFTTVNSAPSSNCNDDVQELVLSRDPNQRSVDLNGSLHPYYLVGRLSLGVAFD